MRVLILGAGGVGGYVGGKLVAAGADVVFLVRGARLVQLAETGLVIESPLGDLSVPVTAVDRAPAGPPPDVVVLACKAPALGGALEVVATAVGPETRVLPFLNGVAHLETLRTRFPQSPLLGGIAHGALTLTDRGVIRHLTPFFSAIVGPVSAPSDGVAEEVVALLGAAGAAARLSPDIRRDMWSKFVFLATLAGITCLMRASVGTILATDDGEALILQLLDECLAVGRCAGFAPDAEAMAGYRRVLTERGSGFTSSMLRDVISARPTEADHILGDMLRRAREAGLATPLLAIAYAHLQCFEAGVG